MEANLADEPPNIQHVSFSDIPIDPVVLRVQFYDFYNDQCLNTKYLEKKKVSKKAIADYDAFTKKMSTPTVLLSNFIRID